MQASKHDHHITGGFLNLVAVHSGGPRVLRSCYNSIQNIASDLCNPAPAAGPLWNFAEAPMVLLGSLCHSIDSR